MTFYFQKLEEFPEALTKVAPTLRNLDLSNNRITAIPSWIGNFKSLKTLKLSNNRLTRLPSEIGQLVKLETLIISGNILSDLPATMANLKNLKELDASRNKLTQFPVMLGQLRHLNSADLSSNQITNVPDGVEALQLTELNLNQNQISAVSKNMANCPRLKTLRLEENCLALEALPTEILTKSQISTLHTAGNLFSEKKLAEAEGYSVYMERYTAVRRKMD